LAAVSGGPFARMKVGALVRKVIAQPGILHIKSNERSVSMMPFTSSEALTGRIDHLNRQRMVVP